MSILSILLVVVLLGLIVWLADRYVPMDAEFRTIFHVVAVVLLVLYLLHAFGVWDLLWTARV